MLERCPRCQYSLQGLPPEGRCPECGLTYDEQSRAWSTKPGIFHYKICIFALLALFAASRVVDDVYAGRTADLGFDATMLVIMLAALVQTWRSVREKHRTVAIVADGVLIDLPETKQRLIPWAQIKQAESTSPLTSAYLMVEGGQAYRIDDAFHSSDDIASFIAVVHNVTEARRCKRPACA